MSATSDFLETAERRPIVFERLRGARTLVRLGWAVFGTGCLMAGVMLWIAPGALWQSDVVLFKAVLTVLMGAFGSAALGLATRRTDKGSEVEVDLVRREVRVARAGAHDGVHGGAHNAAALQQHVCAFADLGRVEAHEGVVQLWDASGVHLADVAVRCGDTQRLLVGALRDAGKL